MIMMEDKMIPIDDLILFLEDTKKQVYKQCPGTKSSEIYISQYQLDKFFNEFGDIANEDGTLQLNEKRISSIKER